MVGWEEGNQLEGGGTIYSVRRRSAWGGVQMCWPWEEEDRFGGRGGGADVYDRKDE